MFGKPEWRKGIAGATLASMLVAGILLVLPTNAFAQYGEMLYSPGQGQSSRTLRSPLIPGAPNSAPYQPAFQGQPPPVGDGATPAGLIGGDMGGPQGVYSGMADQTHGNIFPTRGGQGTDYPGDYVPGAGRRVTENGQQQGMFDMGQGQTGGTGMGPGGANGGTFWGSGGKNGGTGTVNNGGSAGGATGMGPGGSSGGTFWGPGGKNGGTGLVNNGGSAGGATGMSGGGKNGGTGSGPGGKNGGTGVVNNGGNNGGVGTVNNGGNAGGSGLTNNGGPAPGAQGSGDRMYAHQKQPNRYDFQGPLPTVRTFSRYLVILGAVSATVFMAMAAWGMVMGAPYGGSRVMGAAAGLLLLLAGYTIWKIVQMNTFHANSTGWESHYRDGSPQNIPGPGGGAPTNGPFTGPSPPPVSGNGPTGGGPTGGGPTGGPAAGPPGGGPFPQPPGSPFGPAGAPGG